MVATVVKRVFFTTVANMTSQPSPLPPLFLLLLFIVYKERKGDETSVAVGGGDDDGGGGDVVVFQQRRCRYEKNGIVDDANDVGFHIPHLRALKGRVRDAMAVFFFFFFL